MAIEIFPAALCWNWRYVDTPTVPHTVVKYAGSQDEQRSIWSDRYYRKYDSVVLDKITTAERETFEVFLANINIMRDSWFVVLPLVTTRTAIPLVGVTDGANKDFTPPISGRFAGDYPVDDIPNTVIRDDATPVTVDNVDPDTRTWTLNLAPAAASVMDGDYPFYLRLKFTAEPQIVPIAPGVFDARFNVMEVNA